jgi:RNA polymerase sigma-70 factor (ECF subfamily)
LRRIHVLEQQLSFGAASAELSLAGVDAPRLRRIVERHFDVLWRFLRRLGIPEADVDDAVQEVILVVARRLGDIEQQSERSFVFSTAFRIASDMRRRAERRREVGDALLEGLQSAGLDPEATMESQRLAVLFAQVLEQLSLELRVVFVLYELEDFTMAEIAATLGVPPGTVASRLRRGREAFERLATKSLGQEKSEP